MIIYVVRLRGIVVACEPSRRRRRRRRFTHRYNVHR